jgi:uncharacterized membrane protein YtjA (UPF0391 family)
MTGVPEHDASQIDESRNGRKMHTRPRIWRAIYRANGARTWHVDCSPRRAAEVARMVHLAITLFIVAIVAAILGFGGIVGSAAALAKLVFFIFSILAIASFAFGRRPT